MKSVWLKIHKLSNFLHLPDIPKWLLATLSFVFLLRIPSFFEPYYYGDEMIYLTLGQGVRQGVALYQNLHDNKPPLLYLTAAIAGNLFWFKVVLAFWSILTIIIFHKLVKVIAKKNKKVQMLSTIVFALVTTLPLLEGQIANAELFMIVFTIGALLILLTKGWKPKWIYFAGTLLGLGALFKIPAAFDAPVIVFYWVITEGFKNWKKILKGSFILSLGFATPILITFIWYFTQGALPEYIKAAFLQNVGYLSSFRPEDVQKSFLVRNAPLLIRGSIVLLVSLIVFIYRKALSKRFILLTLWVVFALFAVTLSERPYPHYLIQVVAPSSILLAIFFAEKSLEQSLAVIPLALVFFVPFYYKFWYYPIGSYYTRFINYAFGRIDKTEYFNEFSPKVNRDYQIADFIITSSPANERVFMWDPDSPAVYALSKRFPPTKYVADYHINDFSTKDIEAEKIINNPPKFIILTNSYTFDEISKLIKKDYLLINQIDDANIYSRIDFAPTK